MSFRVLITLLMWIIPSPSGLSSHLGAVFFLKLSSSLKQSNDYFLFLSDLLVVKKKKKIETRFFGGFTFDISHWRMWLGWGGGQG